MLIMGVRDFFVHRTKKNRPAPLSVMRKVAAAIITKEGLAPSFYRVKIEHLNTVNNIRGLSVIVRFSHSTIIIRTKSGCQK